MGLVLNIELNSNLTSFSNGMKRTRPAVTGAIVKRMDRMNRKGLYQTLKLAEFNHIETELSEHGIQRLEMSISQRGVIITLQGVGGGPALYLISILLYFCLN